MSIVCLICCLHVPNDPITTIHHRLLSLVTRKPVTDDNWPYIISKMAYSARITNDIDSEYEEYNIKEKLLLLKVQYREREREREN